MRSKEIGSQNPNELNFCNFNFGNILKKNSNSDTSYVLFYLISFWLYFTQRQMTNSRINLSLKWSVDGVLGIRTQGCRMKRADEPWGHGRPSIWGNGYLLQFTDLKVSIIQTSFARKQIFAFAGCNCLKILFQKL